MVRASLALAGNLVVCLIAFVSNGIGVESAAQAQVACQPASYAILTESDRHRFGLDQPDGSTFYSGRSFVSSSQGEFVVERLTGGLRRLDGTVAAATPQGEFRSNGVFAVGDELYFAGARVWRLSGASWVSVGNAIPGVGAGTGVTAIASRNGSLVVACNRQVFELRSGIWRSIVDGQAYSDPAYRLPGDIISLIEFNGALFAGIASNAGGVPGMPSASFSCIWRFSSGVWQPVFPDLVGLAGSLLVYQSRLYAAGVMKLPETPSSGYVYLASIHDGICEPVLMYTPSSPLPAAQNIAATIAGGKIFCSSLPARPFDNIIGYRGAMSYDGVVLRDEFPGVERVVAVWPLASGPAALGVAPILSGNGSRQQTLFQFGTPPPPLINVQTRLLTRASANSSRSLAMTVQTSVAASISVQWRRNGSPIMPGQTPWNSTIARYTDVAPAYVATTQTYTLEISRIRAQDAGIYDAVISTPCGVTISDPVTLDVCIADFNASGSVTSGDLFEFLEAWFTSSGAADVDATPGVGVSDLFEFLSAFFAGCP